MRFRILMLLCLLAPAWICPTSVAEDIAPVPRQKQFQRLLEIAEELRVQMRVPGVGLSLIVDHQPLFAGGLGLRDVAQNLPVDEDTCFGICSNTKSMTGLLVTQLVSRGILDWDRPIREYLPSLQLSDAYVQQHVTLADACSHMTGLARRDELWKNPSVTRADVLNQIKSLPFESSLREEFHYNNHMFVLVGHVIEIATGKSWEQNIEDEIFRPLGMTDSGTGYADFIHHPKHSMGYAIDGQTQLAHVNVDCVGPSGSVCSTPKDLMKWLRLWVGRGVIDGKTLIAEQSLEAYERPRSASMVSSTEFKSYWAGWGLKIVNGQVEYRHSGGIDGLNSTIRARPSDGFGVFVVTNQRSDYKDLIADYADQLMNERHFTRDVQREHELILTAHFRCFATLLMVSRARADEVRSELALGDLEPELNALGYELMRQEQYEKARFVFKINTEENPSSPNAWDSLGECEYETARWKQALSAYRKCLELDAKQSKAKTMIERIQRDHITDDSPSFRPVQ
ncbi:MAG: serine hydrolase [Planctomycetota bacterium]